MSGWEDLELLRDAVPSARARLRGVDALRRRMFFQRNPAGDPASATHTPIPGWRLARASSNPDQGRLLAAMAILSSRRKGTAVHVVEFGTCVGVSALYLACGLAEGSGGTITSFEGRSDVARLARSNVAGFLAEHDISNVDFQLVEGQFEETVEPFFARLPEQGCDLVFVDGHHQEHPTLRYHELARSALSPRGIIVHDDIAWSKGMARAWREIASRDGAEARIIELHRGWVPSRAVLLYGEPSPGGREVVHSDGLARRIPRWLIESISSRRVR